MIIPYGVKIVVANKAINMVILNEARNPIQDGRPLVEKRNFTCSLLSSFGYFTCCLLLQHLLIRTLISQLDSQATFSVLTFHRRIVKQKASLVFTFVSRTGAESIDKYKHMVSVRVESKIISQVEDFKEIFLDGSQRIYTKKIDEVTRHYKTISRSACNDGCKRIWQQHPVLLQSFYRCVIIGNYVDFTSLW